MFSKKLEALDYYGTINIEDETSFQQLVYWLENTKIRFYAPEDRDSLLPDAKNWNDYFNKYLEEISYQGEHENKKKVLDFLLTIALQYEMEDMETQMKLSKNYFTNLVKSNSTNVPIDPKSKEFIDDLKELSHLLNVPFYQEEPLITLRAIAILLKELSKTPHSADKSTSQPTSDSKKKRICNQVDENVLKQPFSKNFNYTPVLNRAANVLRLLYIKDLRELQTQINALIVRVQCLTANPKTDTTLGKVGIK